GRPGEPRLAQQRRGDAALRRVRGLDALAGGAGVVELREPAGIVAGKADRLADALVGITTAEHKAARGGRRREHVAGAGALEAAPEMARRGGKARCGC